MTRRLLALSLLGLLAIARPLAAQDPEPAPDGAAAPPPASGAHPEDVESIDAIIGAIYDGISGPKGAARDWERLRALFVPGARLFPVIWEQGAAEARVMTVEEFIEITGPAFDRDGFYEREIARTTVRFGHIAHVFSTYEARRARDEEPFVRGINSIQLFHDGARWWILSIVWDTERPGNPIPEAYLHES